MLRFKPMMAVATVLVAGAAMFVLPAVTEAGRLGGPLVVEGVAGADDYDVYTARFEGGKQAKIGVVNTGKCDLDLIILDPKTLKVVAQDTKAAADAHVKFTPPSTREYVIIVHNYTKNKSCKYVMFTN